MRPRIFALLTSLALALGVLTAGPAGATDESFTLSVSLRTGGGTPVAHSTVVVFGDAGAVGYDKTDDDGVVTFDLPPGEYTVHRGWEAVDPTGVSTPVTLDGTMTLDLVVGRLVAVSGRFIDKVTGKPYPDVVARARSATAPTVTLFGDDQGRFRAYGAPAAYNLWLDHGYEEQNGRLVLEAGTDRTDVTLSVYGPAGVAGKVTAGGSGRRTWIRLDGELWTMSRDDGRLREVLRPGTYTSLAAEGDDQSSRWFTTYHGNTVREPDARPFVVSSGRTTTIDIPLIRSATVTGKVVGRDGRPVRYTGVHLQNLDRAGSADTVTDSYGRFTAHGLASGKAALWVVDDEDSVPAMATRTLTVSQGATTTLSTITLADDAIVYGRVLTTGSSTMDQDVTLTRADGEPIGTFRPDYDGYVGWAALPAGTYYVHVDGANIRRKVVVSAHKVASFGTLRRGPLTQVSGYVTTSSGAPAANAKVVAWDRYSTSYKVTRTNSRGYFSLTAVRSGSYTLVATPAGGTDAATRVTISVTSGKKLSRNLRLPKGATVTGLVVNSAGKPAIGVWATTVDGRKVATDKTGRYTLTGLRPGATRVYISDDTYVGGYRDTSVAVTAKSGAKVTAPKATVR